MSSTTAYNRLYINGAFVDGTGEETFDVLSPVTGALVSSIPVPSSSDLDAAVRAANG
jgi:acyl-CoA reductase-like NAD-dependent aldehyde dehydrogenase